MASFTDSLGALTQFNPYVQQLPVEAMVSVGQQKQQQYNEGVQKIQSHIDQIAGMDVVRDVDRQYLQSQLNNLGTNLKKVAAGDFSNYQLVNSVSGMATRIGKDSNVQSAVASTARYRKEVANMEAAIKDGKSAIQNEWDFSNKANAWLGSTELKQSFSDRYTPYIDVSKKWMEVVKGLHSDLVDMDIAYELNADGSPNYSKTLAAMQRVSKESVSSAKIENALRASLSPLEANQLSIDGRFTFRGAPPEALQSHATSKYQSAIKTNEARIKDLEGLANLSTSDSEKRKMALASIESLRENNKQLTQDLNDELDFIARNPEEAKAMIYKNGAIAQFAQAHSWEHSKENLMTNPVLQAEQWEKNYALNVAKTKFDMDMANKDYLLKTKDYDLKAKKLMFETFGSNTPFTTYLEESTVTKSPKRAMMNDIYDNQQTVNSMKNNISTDLGITEDQLNNAIIAYQEGDAEKIGSANKYIPVEYREQVNSIIELELKNKRLKNGIKQVEDELLKTGKYNNTLPPVTVKGPNGEEVTFTPDEVSNFLGRDLPSPESGEPLENRFSEKELILLKQNPKMMAEIVKKYGDATKEFDDAVNSKLLERGGTYIPRVSNITFGSDEGNIARATWENIAGAALLRFKDDKTPGGADTLASSDVSKGRTWLEGTEKKDIQYRKLVQGNKTFLMLTRGDDQVVIPLTGEEVAQLPLQDSEEPNVAYAELVQAQKLGNGNSNPTGKPQDAYFQRFHMPSLKKLNVVADLTQNKSTPGKNYISLQVKLPQSGWVSLKVEGTPVTRERGAQVIRELTDEQVKQLFLQDPTVSQSVKEELTSIQ